MNPEMHNDPFVLLALAAVVWLLFAAQTWRLRLRKQNKPSNRERDHQSL